MKLIVDIVTAGQTSRELSNGTLSVSFRKLTPASARRRAAPATELQSPLAADRRRSSMRARRANAPASGPGGVLKMQISRLEEADREWFDWRFGEDA